MLEIRLTEAPDPADGWLWRVIESVRHSPGHAIEITGDYARSYDAATKRARDAFDKIMAYRANGVTYTGRGAA